MQPPSERPLHESKMSKVSGACTPTLGCSPADSFQALKRMPATHSPERPVGLNGTRRPLHATAWRPALKPSTRTCRRSMEGSTERVVEAALGLKPLRIEMIAGGAAQIVQHAEKVLPDEMLQHEPVVQGRAPADGGAALRLAPEPGDQRAHEQLLCQAHARVRRHFERAEFDQAEASGRTVGREQLVDANFGAVGVAGDVDEKVAKQTVDQPRARWGALARRRHHRECDFELIELVIACLVDTRSLAG